MTDWIGEPENAGLYESVILQNALARLTATSANVCVVIFTIAELADEYGPTMRSVEPNRPISK